MKFSAILALLPLALASPTPTTVEKRATTYCGQWDSAVTGTYTVYNNLWGMSSGTGSQCTTLTGLSGSNLQWSTTWSWSGGQYNVKSYANAVVNVSKKALSAISSIPSTWNWSYSGTGLVANVAYDLFTSSTATGSAQYEIMIWLGSLGGAGPISATGSAIATPTVAGRTWNLYKGVNGQMTVFSFVAPSNVQSFSGDLKAFATYLINSQGLPSSQILQSIGAGTEPFVGSNAKFTTTAYTASLS
ncbi:glycosyl hydrolase family 12 [Colletotrichum paranaense]|uniref:Glycoside hydrolase family 12 protein n=9 Tax=Colletotrichum acutatum species complex TaxID=2707335 RepID=A0A9P7RC23_9PEZI|nr:glycosyl hydrolase family 12 [Colletotrichum costaricense]XP_060354005.1 glycosyl hydrolase family 12 [Colletotrichum paranaense]XP_060379107.1 glycosyl hydrolase family 12 [Colletotrichum tamarilloi]XP_060391334.1 glycosyl hydrolase family 12 [Colletotrichum abscissum]KAG7053429.1 glycoside hydrolase family 12 protein [Colletotrichum scovillei]KAI3531642.1 glycosyl hydrolase family 12 [Colletotrichum filicis]KAK0378535.1 glycosyl hydrolase family 12 [Colletotrichum limetticola]KAK1472369